MSKEEEDAEAGSPAQGQAGPPGLGLPAPSLQGVADGVRLGGVEARVEVDGDVGRGVQAAATLEVHLEPVGGEALKGTPLRGPGGPEGREEPPCPPPSSRAEPAPRGHPYLRASSGTTPCSMTILPARKPPKMVVT